MRLVYADDGPTLDLGLQGENKARQVVFDITDFVESYGEGRVELLFHRNGDDEPMLRPYMKSGTKLYWTITALDTEIAGSNHECALRYYVGDTVIKSNPWRVTVHGAMQGPEG